MFAPSSSVAPNNPTVQSRPPSWTYTTKDDVNRDTTHDDAKAEEKARTTTTTKTKMVLLEASSEAQREADRRRGLAETYTTDITTSSVKLLTMVTDFMSDFNKFAETYEGTFQNHLQEYKDDLQLLYHQLVPQEVTHKTFLQRYFFRCGDLQRIQDELDADQESKKRRQNEEEQKMKQNPTTRIRIIPEEPTTTTSQQSSNTTVADTTTTTTTTSPTQQQHAPPAPPRVRWKGVSSDSVLKRAAWEVSEGARIDSLRATKPPTSVQRQVTMELGSDAAKAVEQAALEFIRAGEEVKLEEEEEEGHDDDDDDDGIEEEDAPHHRHRNECSNRGNNKRIINEEDKRTSVSTTPDNNNNNNATPLYSRLRFPFRRNLQQSQPAVALIVHKGVEENNKVTDKKNEQNPPPTRSPSMSPSQSLSIQPSISGVEEDKKKKVGNNNNESVQRAFWSIRERWDRTMDTTFSKQNEGSSIVVKEKNRGSSLEDSHTDLVQQEHMTIVSSSSQKSSSSTTPTAATLTIPSSRDRNMAPTRSSSARDLINKMEAVNQERRDRTRGPPVTTTQRGRIPTRRMSESGSIPVAAEAAAPSSRSSMRNFRSSSFAYRNRGTSPTARNDLTSSSNHSLPVEAASAATPNKLLEKKICKPAFVGTVRSRSLSTRTADSSRSQVAPNGLSKDKRPSEGDPSASRVEPPHHRSRSATSSTGCASVNLDHTSFSSFQQDEEEHEHEQQQQPVPRQITTTHHHPLLKTTTDRHSGISSLMVVSSDPLALKSVVRANRRRNIADTYTEPLEAAMNQDPTILPFLQTFDLQQWRDQAMLALARYQDTLLIQHEQYVLSGAVSEHDFWSRYFFRCDERRILQDMRRKDELGILGQSSRDLFAVPGNTALLNSSGAKQAFRRGPQLGGTQRASSFSVSRQPPGGRSLHQGSREKAISPIARSQSLGGGGPTTKPSESLKEKLRNWTNVSQQSSTAANHSQNKLSAESRAERYRRRAGY